MRSYHFLPPTLVLIATLTVGFQASSPALAGDRTQLAGSHGTAVDLGRAWEAVQRAGQENKLLMLVHIAGVFEDPTFT
jgi:hypothetical protein